MALDQFASAGRWHAAPRAHPSPRVLIAEDNEESRDILTEVFREDGYEVTPVADGGRLLVRLAHDIVSTSNHEAYDLMVFDICMPVCSGLQILEELRKAHWPTPAILITGFADDGTRARVEALGGILFEKPFDVDALRTAALHLICPLAESGDALESPRPPRAVPHRLP